MPTNLVLWLPQVTIDYTFMLPEHIEQICGHFAKNGFFPEHRHALQNIADFGLKQDHNLRLDTPADLERALDHVRGQFPETEIAQIGGNSAIAALRGFYLAARDRDHSIPLSRYVGIYPVSLGEFVAKQQTSAPDFYRNLCEVFDRSLCFEIPEKPMSLALEGHYKVIIAYGHGRRLDNIAPKGNFSTYLKRLGPIISQQSHKKVLFAFPSVPFPLDLGAKLLNQIQKSFGGRALFYIGSSSFRDGSTLDFARTDQMWHSVLKHAHILSMNETELGDLHTVVVGKGTFQDKPLTYKLLELPIEAIKICHGADGALMDPGPDPGSVVNAVAFHKNPFAFLEESLRLAADGASYSLASPAGHDATEASVRIFSATVQHRNTDRFKATFLNVLESMPPGLIAVHTPVVARTMSALTGVGARFDGLLATFLMRC